MMCSPLLLFAERSTKKGQGLQRLVRTTRRTKTVDITTDVISASRRQKVTVLQK